MVETRSRSASRARVATTSVSGAGVTCVFWLRVSLAATFGSGAAAFGSVMGVSSVSTGSVGWVVAGVAASIAGVWVLSVIGDAPCSVGASRRWRTQS